MVFLVAMKGPPGVGKSTLARALSHHLSWAIIDKDDIKDVLDGQSPRAGALSYEVMLSLVRRQATQGLSVICDSPLHQRTYVNLGAIAAETGTHLVIVECMCSSECVWQERIAARQYQGMMPHHAVTWAAVQDFVAQSGTRYSMAHPHLVVDTNHALAQSVATVTNWLNELHPPSVSNYP